MALARLDRAEIFPEKTLPDAQALIAEGRKMAQAVTVGRSPFLASYGVEAMLDRIARMAVERANAPADLAS